MIREYVVKVTDTFLPGAFQRFESEWAPEQELIRCKDCKNRPDNHQMELDGELYLYCELHRRWTTDEWFCADGERKEGR